MFGGYGGFSGNNNPFVGGFGELASDWAINHVVPGGLNGMFHKMCFIILFQLLFI